MNKIVIEVCLLLSMVAANYKHHQINAINDLLRNTMTGFKNNYYGINDDLGDNFDENENN